MDFINSYAIVAYVAGPIARFADRLRDDVVLGTGHHSHITVLPPRPVSCALSEATEFAARLIAQFEPFEVGIGEVSVFESTQVVYLSITEGTAELAAMHDVLNTGILEQQEQFDYIPHITLGQQLLPEAFHASLELCRLRWAEFRPAPPLRIDTLTLVQQRTDGCWHDLVELALGRVTAVG